MWTHDVGGIFARDEEFDVGVDGGVNEEFLRGKGRRAAGNATEEGILILESVG